MEGEACSVQTQEQGPPSAKSSDIVFLNPVISFRPPEVFWGTIYWKEIKN